jgi:hypothetical protein
LADIEKMISEAGYLKLSYHVPNILNLRGYEVRSPSEKTDGGSTDFELLKRGYLEYLGLVVDRTIKDKVWKQLVVKDSHNEARLEELLDHISTSEEIDWGDYSGSLVEFDVFVSIEPAYFDPLEPYVKTMTIEGIRNIVFGLQITSAVRDLPTKNDLIRLGALPSPTAEHHEFTQEKGEREKGNRTSRKQ